MKTKWVLVTVAVSLGVIAAVGLLAHSARADATVATLKGDWAITAAPITKGGDVVGYNIYVFQEKTAMLWAWEYGGERQLLRVPTRDQYEPGHGITSTGKPLGAAGDSQSR